MENISNSQGGYSYGYYKSFKVFLGIIVAVSLTLLVAPFHPVQAQAGCTKTWVSPVSGNWTDPTKWSLGTIPSSDDNVCITVDGAYTVTVGGAQTVNSVTVGAPGNTLVQTLLLLGNGSGGSAILTAANGFTNAGSITMDAQNSGFTVNLIVTSGTLTNTGAINVNAGTGGSRSIAAQLNNQGTINLNYGITIEKASAQHTNTGTINISGGNLSLNQSGASPSFVNTGTISVSSGRIFYINTGVFTQNSPGNISGLGQLNFYSATFNWNNGTVPTPTSHIIHSSTLNIGAAATSAASFTTWSASNISGNISANQAVLILGNGSGGSAILTAANGFTNAGSITMDAQNSGFTVNLIVTSGTLTNTGAINVNAGTGGSRSIAAQLNNQGTINLNYGTTIEKANAQHTNSQAPSTSPEAILA